MTREEILQMDERGLYLRVLVFVLGYQDCYAEKKANGCAKCFSRALLLCHQAEEKIKEMGKRWDYARNLVDILDSDDLPTELFEFDMIHAHPKQRAQAVLLTINKEQP